MARARLAPASIRLLGPGLHHDGAGLYLQRKLDPERKIDGRSWLLRYKFAGRTRWMGLGAFPSVSLAEARRAADDARQLLRQGVDPIEARRQRKLAAQLEAARAVTFQAAAERTIEAKRVEWTNGKQERDWRQSLRDHAYPKIGRLPVQAIETADVLRVLEPIWLTNNVTARRVRGRIEEVLGWATALGLRTGDNPARWKANLDALLPKPEKVHRSTPHEAMPYADVPEFFGELVKREHVRARALAFTILTGVRTSVTRLATWGEIDVDAKVWTIAPERNKAREQFRVPLTDEMIALLGEPGEPDALLFATARGRPLRADAMREYLTEDMGQSVTVHGFRASFRTWAAEQTNFAREVCETALAHNWKGKVERVYDRDDRLEKRRPLMAAWSRYCATGAAKGKVLPMQRKATG